MTDSEFLPVTAIQRFCMHDGPGIRTTVFLAGCPLRCKWCHNPETQSVKAQIMFQPTLCIGCGECAKVCKSGARCESGIDRSKCVSCFECAGVCPSGALKASYKLMSIDEIFAEVEKDRDFYGSDGGITVSGGEPTMHIDGVEKLLFKCKNAGFTTAIETCGYFKKDYLERLCACVDTFLWDFKDSDEKRHMENTGVSNVPIVENLKTADSMGAKTVLRCILLEGVNFTDEHICEIKKLKSELANCMRVDLLPYHPMGKSKGDEVGMDMSFHDSKYIPDDKKVADALKFING